MKMMIVYQQKEKKIMKCHMFLMLIFSYNAYYKAEKLTRWFWIQLQVAYSKR